MNLTRRKFTEEELDIISKNNGKVTLKKLANELLGINYSVLSTMMNEQNIEFKSIKTSITREPVESSAMTKKYNEFNEELLTDEHLNQWFAY